MFCYGRWIWNSITYNCISCNMFYIVYCIFVVFYSFVCILYVFLCVHKTEEHIRIQTASHTYVHAADTEIHIYSEWIVSVGWCTLYSVSGYWICYIQAFLFSWGVTYCICCTLCWLHRRWFVFCHHHHHLLNHQNTQYKSNKCQITCKWKKPEASSLCNGLPHGWVYLLIQNYNKKKISAWQCSTTKASQVQLKVSLKYWTILMIEVI